MPEANGHSLIPSRILVPVDFSSSSHAALEQAAAFAQQFHAEIHLVHVIPMFPAAKMSDFVPEAEFVDRATREAEKHFAACQFDLGALGIKMTSGVEVGGDAAACIVDVIEREKIDLVVVSTHGLTGWQPVVFGSIAEKLLKLVNIPVLLIRTPKPNSRTRAHAGRLKKHW
ncbi:MAG: universal stress protein [Terracidiphilus sp.]|nr:universal stress protein [Terracidiphilus sp.]